jgi:hypothetical protein
MIDDGDAQRAREQEALQKVRALVESIEAEDRGRVASELRLIAAAIVGVALFIGILFIASQVGTTSGDREESARRSSLEAQQALHESAASYRRNPRRKFVGGTMEPRFAAYVDKVAGKIERLGNTEFKSQLRGVTGKVQVTMAIRFDGNIESVEVGEHTGGSAVPTTAVHLVRRAEPFEWFPEDVRRDTDVLHITRTFHFGKAAAKP